jgi:pimeloyl-ACP methyl ester carboxylesterase
VWGREDKIVPWQHGEVLAQSIARSKLAVIAEASHTPMREKRETFSASSAIFSSAKRKSWSVIRW